MMKENLRTFFIIVWVCILNATFSTSFAVFSMDRIVISNQKITTHNTTKLEQVAVLGQGQFLEMRWLSDTVLGVVTTAGVWLYDVSTASTPSEPLETYFFQVNGLRHASLSPDGKLFAVTDEACGMTVFDLPSKEIVFSTIHKVCATDTSPFDIPRRGFSLVTFSGDGTIIAAATYDGKVYLWRSTSGETLHIVDTALASIHALALDTQGQQLTTVGVGEAGAETVILWDVSAQIPIRSWHETLPYTSTPWPSSSAMGATFSADGTLIASLSYGSVAFWNTQNQELLSLGETYRTHVSAMTIAPYAEPLVALGIGGMAKVLTTTGTEVFTSPLITSRVQGLAFNTSVPWLAVAFDDAIRVWNIKTHEAVAKLADFTSPVYTLAFSTASDQLAAGYVNGNVRLWNVKNWTQRRSWWAGPRSVYGVDFAPNGDSLLLTTAIPDVQLWELVPLHRQRHIALSIWTITPCAEFDFTGEYFAFNDGIDVRVWDAQARDEHFIVPREDPAVWKSFAFASTSRTLAVVGGDNRLYLWDAQTQTLTETLPSPQVATFAATGFSSIAFSPSDHWIGGVGNSGGLTLWDTQKHTATQPVLLQTYGPATWGNSTCSLLAFNPDETLLAIPSEENTVPTVEIWDIQTSQAVVALRGHTLSIYAVAFSPDGRWLATASQDGTVRIWGVPAEEE